MRSPLKKTNNFRRNSNSSKVQVRKGSDRELGEGEKTLQEIDERYIPEGGKKTDSTLCFRSSLF